MITDALPPLSHSASPVRLSPEDWRRIGITTSCHDCDDLPKAPGAGQVFVGADGTRFQLMHNGVRVTEDCYYGAWMTELIRQLRGHHEPQEELVFQSLLKHLEPGATMIELGSYWGYYSLWFRKCIPDGRSHMLEPDPQHLEIGRQNFAINDETGTFHHLAVGSQSLGPKPFRCDDGRVAPAVAQISLDDFLAREGIKYVDLLLADIQGAEWGMLQGAKHTIEQGKLRFAVISTHHHSISGDPLTHQKCLAFLQEHQGHILAVHNVTESFSGDGLLVVSFDPRDRSLSPINVSRNHATNSLFRELEYDLAEALRVRKQAPVHQPAVPHWSTVKAFVNRILFRH